MTNRLTRSVAATLTLAVIALSACKDKASEDVLAQDTSLNRDLALANSDTLAQPQLKDVPAQSDSAMPAPSRVARTPAEILTPRGPLRSAVTRPAPQPVAAAPIPAQNVTPNGNTVTANAAGSEAAMGTIAGGSVVSLYSGQRVCTNTNAVGDRFTANVAEAVLGTNGVSIPAGATVVLEITAVKRSTNPNDNIELEMLPLSIGFNSKTYPLTSTVTYAQVDKVRDATRGDDARKVATGAAIGAIAGQIFGHHTRSTIIGAGVGAAAGAIDAAVTTKVDGCVPSGGRITLRLNQAIMISAT
jgi:YMGG-like Gly-zipper